MPFTFTQAPLKGLTIIEARPYTDTRGFFLETYKESDFSAGGISSRFVQDNHSRSVRGVLRGLHFQSGEKAQGKLVRVVSGTVWDVAVDIRPGSPTHGAWWGIELSGDIPKMLFIPEGFAHGFLTLSDEAHLVYKCTAEYDHASERGIRWDDPDLNIAWPNRDAILSDKDASLPFLRDLA